MPLKKLQIIFAIFSSGPYFAHVVYSYMTRPIDKYVLSHMTLVVFSIKICSGMRGWRLCVCVCGKKKGEERIIGALSRPSLLLLREHQSYSVTSVLSASYLSIGKLTWQFLPYHDSICIFGQSTQINN